MLFFFLFWLVALPIFAWVYSIGFLNYLKAFGLNLLVYLLSVIVLSIVIVVISLFIPWFINIWTNGHWIDILYFLSKREYYIWMIAIMLVVDVLFYPVHIFFMKLFTKKFSEENRKGILKATSAVLILSISISIICWIAYYLNFDAYYPYLEKFSSNNEIQKMSETPVFPEIPEVPEVPALPEIPKL